MAEAACSELRGHSVMGLSNALHLQMQHVQQVQDQVQHVCEATKDILRQLSTDEQVLAALRQLSKPAEACDLNLRLRGADGDALLSVAWTLQDTLKDKILRMLLLVLDTEDGSLEQVRSRGGNH